MISKSYHVEINIEGDVNSSVNEAEIKAILEEKLSGVLNWVAEIDGDLVPDITVYANDEEDEEEGEQP